MSEKILRLLEQTIDARVSLESFLAVHDHELESVDTARRATYSLRSATEYLLEAYGLAVLADHPNAPSTEAVA